MVWCQLANTNCKKKNLYFKTLYLTFNEYSMKSEKWIFLCIDQFELFPSVKEIITSCSVIFCVYTWIYKHSSEKAKKQTKTKQQATIATTKPLCCMCCWATYCLLNIHSLGQCCLGECLVLVAVWQWLSFMYMCSAEVRVSYLHFTNWKWN